MARPSGISGIGRNSFYLYFKKSFIFHWRIIDLQYCVGFCHNQHESAIGIHTSPSLLNFPPTFLLSLYIFYLQALPGHSEVSCAQCFPEDPIPPVSYQWVKLNSFLLLHFSEPVSKSVKWSHETFHI